MDGEENQINTGETTSFRTSDFNDGEGDANDISFQENRQNTPFGDDATIACSHNTHQAELQSDIPRQLGRYEVRSLVGRGGFGAVYLGWDPQLEREVAIKIPRFTTGDGSNAAEQSAKAQEDFLREARKAVRLERHAGIVPVYDTGVENGVCYIVSQFIDGGTLRQLQKSGTLSAKDSLLLMARIAETIEFAHQHGWVHRDIKPSNILIDKQGNPYLTDFGLTATVEELRADAGPQQGTPNYMAPELARHVVAYLDGQAAETEPGSAGKASDIYSLGVVLFELLTGKLPFDGENYRELFNKVLNSPAPSLEEAGLKTLPQLNRVCQQALAKQPAERFESAAQFASQLKALAGAIDHQTAEPAISRGRLPVMVAAGVIVLVLVGLAIAASSGWLQPPGQQETGDPGDGPLIAMTDQTEMEAGNEKTETPAPQSQEMPLDVAPPADAPPVAATVAKAANVELMVRNDAIRKIERNLDYEFDGVPGQPKFRVQPGDKGQRLAGSPRIGSFRPPGHTARSDRFPDGFSPARPPFKAVGANPAGQMPMAGGAAEQPHFPAANLRDAVQRYQSYALPKQDATQQPFAPLAEHRKRTALTGDVLQLAGREVAAGKLDSAAAALQTLKRRPLTNDPKLIAARHTLDGDIAFKSGDFSASLKAYDAALKATSTPRTQFQLRLRRLRVLLAMDDREQAKQEVATIRKTAPPGSPIAELIEILNTESKAPNPPAYDEPPEPASEG